MTEISNRCSKSRTLSITLSNSFTLSNSMSISSSFSSSSTHTRTCTRPKRVERHVPQGFPAGCLAKLGHRFSESGRGQWRGSITQTTERRLGASAPGSQIYYRCGQELGCG